MPTQSPKFGWPLPVGTDQPDAPGQLMTLATGIEKTIGDLQQQTSAVNQRIDNQISTMSMATGTFTQPFNNSASYSRVVTFPSGRFSATPAVVATIETLASGTALINVRVGNRTATGCTIAVSTFDGRLFTGSVDVAWVAVGS